MKIMSQMADKDRPCTPLCAFSSSPHPCLCFQFSALHRGRGGSGGKKKLLLREREGEREEETSGRVGKEEEEEGRKKEKKKDNKDREALAAWRGTDGL